MVESDANSSQSPVDGPETLYESGDLLAVLKPEGLATIAERDPDRPSLHHWLQEARGERLWVLHRLDKDVSGVVLFARNAESHRRINRAFETRQVEKRYKAVVHGVPDRTRGAIQLPLRTFGSGRVGVDERRGKPSLTRYQVVDTFGSFCLLEVRPETGRRHQIRVHLYHIGHPIVGDPLYGDPAIRQGFGRLMLHAVGVVLPLDGESVQIEAPPTPTFEANLKYLRILIS